MRKPGGSPAFLRPYFRAIVVLSVCLSPCLRIRKSFAAFAASTQTMPWYSSSPKSGIRRDLAIHGFQITVESDPAFET